MSKKNPEAANEAKEKGQAFVLAGGTDLLVKMKGGFLEPDLVVDIKRIKGVFVRITHADLPKPFYVFKVLCVPR